MYSIEFSKISKKFLDNLDKKERIIIFEKIYSIRENPFRFLKRLQGQTLWRLRLKDYRAIVDVIVSGNKIVVLKIGHRKNVYK